MLTVMDLDKGDRFRVVGWNREVILTIIKDQNIKVCVVHDGKAAIIGLGVIAQGDNPNDLYVLPVTTEVEAVED